MYYVPRMFLLLKPHNANNYVPMFLCGKKNSPNQSHLMIFTSRGASMVVLIFPFVFKVCFTCTTP